MFKESVLVHLFRCTGKVVFHDHLFLLKGCTFLISEIRSIFTVHRGMYLLIFYLKMIHSDSIHKGPWMFSAAVFSLQAVLPSEAHSCEWGRSRFFVENSMRLKCLGVWFTETSMSNKKLEMLRKEMLIGKLCIKSYSLQDSWWFSLFGVHNHGLSPGIKHWGFLPITEDSVVLSFPTNQEVEELILQNVLLLWNLFPRFVSLCLFNPVPLWLDNLPWSA